MTGGFKPSIYRIARFYLDQHGIVGSWPEIKEIAVWVKGYEARMYPNCLQEKWPYDDRRYFTPQSHPHYWELIQIVDGWEKCWRSYREYIIESINGKKSPRTPSQATERTRS